MNMNDNEWNEFWDNEPDDEDDEYVGSDVDANNDETFDNAAEWNEDEHEELIARDHILSHTIRNSNNNNNNNNNRNNNNNNNGDGDDAGSSAFVSNVINSAGRAGWNSIGDKDLFPALERQEPQQQRQNQSINLETPWQNVRNTSERLHLLQLQQQHLLLQNRLQEQQHHESQQLRERQILQQQREQPRAQPSLMNMGRQILTVDELEGQIQPKRTGWSPFGGIDLFTTPEQQQILLQQQHQLQQMAILRQQQIQQEQRLMSQNPQCFTVEELERQMMPGRSNNSQTLKVNRERVDGKDHRENLEHRENRDHREQRDHRENREHRENRDHRDNRNHRENRDFRDNRDHRDHRENQEHREQREHRDHRDNRDRREHRDRRDHRNNRRQNLTIIPPQVQLRVLDKAKLFHSLTAMHSDEFLQDRMPTSKDGLLFKRHSTVMREKANHDGVLTERERNWLTKIQEKIQADYDDNLDQDYYYLLYFNRSSMTDEAAQKPCGPGVFDRRFIPRERLLYN